MKCPYCNFEATSVLESRATSEAIGIRRRRECDRCHKRFTTYERVGNIALKVIKRDGRKEDFDRSKLEKGIVKACWKREVEPREIESVIDEIEMKLLNRKSTEVKSADIGNMALTRLKKLDPIAYLRFASVYLEFDSIGDFRKVVDDLNAVTV
jgi:transcriptional repressor NrdR